MRRLLSGAVCVLLLAFAACQTDAPSDITYDSAVLHGTARCKQGTYAFRVQFEIHKVPDGAWERVGPQHVINCSNEPLVDKPIPDTPVDDLHTSTTYQVRLWAEDETYWDATPADDLTIYDEFTTEPFESVVPTAPVGDFRDSEGVNTKTHLLGSPAANQTNTRQALADLGIRRVRESLNYFPNGNGGFDAQMTYLRSLIPLGVKASLSYGCVKTDTPKIAGYLNRLVSESVTDVVDTWEGPNEVNLQHSACDTTGWATNTPPFMAELKQELDARSLAQPVVSPSCGGSHCGQALGDLSASVSVGNVHPYRGTGIPETAVESECPDMEYVVPDGPCDITEFGWSLAQWSGGVERTQASYTLRGLLDYWSKGVPHSYIHQLVDLGTMTYYCGTPTPPPDSACEREATFGLYRYDWTPRLVATAIGRMNSFVGDAGTTDQLAVKFTNTPSDFRYLAFKNGDGDYVLALWRQRAVGPGGTQTVTFELPDAESLELLRPFDSGTPLTPTLTNDVTAFNVSADVEFLKIHPED